MVEYNVQLDAVFHSLSDPIRRDILRLVSHCELTVGELVARFDVSFAAISKHLKVLEEARLIRKRKAGRKHFISTDIRTLQQADEYLEHYRRMWQSRHDKLDSLLQEL
jgi:DNA-binding transcriptional ArsR family regulator